MSLQIDLDNLLKELDIILKPGGQVDPLAVAFALKVSIQDGAPAGFDRLQSQVVDLFEQVTRQMHRMDKLEKPTPTPPDPYYTTANCHACESTFKYRRGPSLHRPICPHCGKPDDVQIAEPELS